ncbi:hypothetical protein RJ639_005651 [Escallonia herrerae]|uniref:RING-type domain-containing protein n=1 Tax=Escallonia herrerae TaxID=1293975 RepID=A0AA88VVW6_9ASTE|nr:hypothetical protein RJ639_005651 [Escallonia herrerae]
MSSPLIVETTTKIARPIPPPPQEEPPRVEWLFDSQPLKPVSRIRCTVCLAEYHAEDTLRILPFCGHFFHATCIDIWLQQHSTCPVCRISLRELPENKRLMQPMFSSAVRSQYVMDALDGNSDHCLSAGRGLSSRGHENRRMEPIQEDQFPSEGD